MKPKWRVYLRLGRVSNLPTVWTNCVAAVILAGGRPGEAIFGLLLASMSLFYIAGMFLNDAFDQGFDRKYRPDRPIPANEISGTAVYGIGFALLAAGFVLLVNIGLLQDGFRGELLGWGIGLAGLIVYCDYRHKADPASPLIMALCRMMVYFASAAMISTALTGRVLAGAGVLTAYLIGLTYVAKQENLSEVKNIWPLAFLAAPFIYAAPVLLRINFHSLQYVFFFGWVIYSLSHLFKQGRKNIPRTVVSLIAGISLLDGVLIASVPEYALWSWLGMAGFVLTLA